MTLSVLEALLEVLRLYTKHHKDNVMDNEGFRYVLEAFQSLQLALLNANVKKMCLANMDDGDDGETEFAEEMRSIQLAVRKSVESSAKDTLRKLGQSLESVYNSEKQSASDGQPGGDKEAEATNDLRAEATALLDRASQDVDGGLLEDWEAYKKIEANFNTLGVPSCDFNTSDPPQSLLPPPNEAKQAQKSVPTDNFFPLHMIKNQTMFDDLMKPENPDSLNPPVVMSWARVSKDVAVEVIRDDVLTGGTKQRALAYLLMTSNATEFVYAGPVFGYAQVALAYVCRRCHKKAVVVVAEQRSGALHPLTQFAEDQGAKIVQVPPPNALKQVQSAGAAYAAERNRSRGDGYCELLPFGLHSDLFLWGLERSLRSSLCPRLLRSPPKRLWLVAGSATLLATFAKVWPQTKFLVVQVGKTIWPDQLEGMDAELFVAPEKFWMRAKQQPPYPSVNNYGRRTLHPRAFSHGRRLLWALHSSWMLVTCAHAHT